jgi:hypothetical protein
VGRARWINQNFAYHVFRASPACLAHRAVQPNAQKVRQRSRSQRTGRSNPIQQPARWGCLACRRRTPSTDGIISQYLRL